MTTVADTLTLHTSYLTLDARHRTVRDALVDTHLMHQLVMSGWREDIFPGEGEPRAELGILYAVSLSVDHRVRLVVQGHTPANWQLAPGVLLGEVDHRARQAPLDGTIAFQLIAAPRKSLPCPPADSGKKRRGKKIAVPAEEREQWGRKALTAAGLEVATLDVRSGARLESETKSLPRKQRATPNAVFTHTTVVYTGTARITDPALHAAALTGGVGPAKAYGCGLLLTRAA
ncbi:type I-E CRISPR-associated protein Cas6/Cse3/CasE [Rhodococcus qingshengii]|uniref:type I-E CRISPR-associated protein Cas6/Cse3/CasE n=1 Tax=Rhodococcus qingshengii TaxID=334542 RepID=UPI001A4D6D20|nr:type I-E CRISPR-associated protein Cas6/Cse3/CasE [Rhodococcus qingshengii]ULD39032.1 type I-E CRISPR-associated protein Cas6/Cse3/CasE [Rhodococcus qingshengii]